MSSLSYVYPSRACNEIPAVGGNRVNDRPLPRWSAGLQALLDAIPDEGDAVDLDDAVALVGQHASTPYVTIVVAMNRGLVAAEHLDLPDFDRPIVIRRL